MNNDPIDSILNNLYRDICCKSYDNESNISSISMGIDDWYQWKREDVKHSRFGHYDNWNGFKIKVCKRRKRLIKFNLCLTRWQKLARLSLIKGNTIKKITQIMIIEPMVKDFIKNYKNEN